MTWNLYKEYNSDINYKEIKFVLSDCYNYKPCASGRTFDVKTEYILIVKRENENHFKCFINNNSKETINKYFFKNGTLTIKNYKKV